VKAAPKPTPETAPYWEAANRGELQIQRCNACARHYFYPRTACPRYGSTDVTWMTASGRGRLDTYLINHRPAPCFEDETPNAIAVVELEEGPRMIAKIVGVSNTAEELELDMPLGVRFEPRGARYAWPKASEACSCLPRRRSCSAPHRLLACNSRRRANNGSRPWT
jgi:hypothetical protein